MVFKIYLDFSVARSKNSDSQQVDAVDPGHRSVCT